MKAIFVELPAFEANQKKMLGLLLKQQTAEVETHVFTEFIFFPKIPPKHLPKMDFKNYPVCWGVIP